MTGARGLTNAEFLALHAAPGRVGLVGGASLIDRAIARAQWPLVPEARRSAWSHAFLFEGERADGRHWVVESDLDVHKKHVRLGVQENRAEKYHDDDAWPRVAVIDFGLSDAERARVLATALDLVARRVRYSLRELVGTLVAMPSKRLRARSNVLAREHAIFCSAFVQHVFREAGVDLVPELDVKLTTPEDVWTSPRRRDAWVLDRAS